MDKLICTRCNQEFNHSGQHNVMENICPNCTRQINIRLTDQVTGFIVGDDETSPYHFYCNGKSFAKGRFASDADAVAWLKINHPDEFKIGIEMRVFDV